MRDRSRRYGAADDARRLAHAWASFAALRWPGAGIDVQRIFPPLGDNRPTEADLDRAGVDPDDADPGDAARVSETPPPA